MKNIFGYSREYLSECFIYEEKTGRLFWKHRPESHFKNRQAFSKFNNFYPGKEAGRLTSYGYLSSKVNGKQLLNHRIAWFLSNDEVPLIMDHINGDRCDNRLVNLRNVDSQKNNQNRQITGRNKSGAVGVCFYKQTNRWHAQIGGKHLGFFINKQDAIDARISAEEIHGYIRPRGQAT